MAEQALQVVGLKELNRAIRRSVDKDLPRRMGQANKSVGQLVIRRLSPKPDPAAVGLGAGSLVRPSASKREVLLRVGGRHRASGVHTRKQPWGKRRAVPPGTHAPDRPNILGTVVRHRDEIETFYLRAVGDALGEAFHRRDF